ncbi:MAG TPA: hypothetical protein DIS90_08060, partial [Cytophagales bacterium]|nr:hypothetical protein [Cytophagales bacterium]
SAYIYDKEALRKKFSYFQEDSTPKILTASKNKYLIAVPESYRKKMRSLKTVEMKPIYPEIPDSLKIEEGADLIMAERDVIDSATVQQGLDRSDSAYAITKAKEKFNVDQDNYMWYFRDQLVLPDVRAALEQKSGKDLGTANLKGSKEKKGFFKNLFRKKDKSDSSAVDGPPLPSDSTKASTKTKKKKAPKEKKVKAKKEEKKETPAKKEEEDDGFDS